ncbi:hypothetical protein [Stenotrophomonas sp. YIM B06876]|uniref:hypothetical protein n=1 Tax=Stenotrophomonas sp. YIM B06876 TaxID=3060211 RepID=UPI002739357C|nr:hypothetical protein [Stenotrophomonas sp. YIM B06876]
MNAQSLAIALALAAGTALASTAHAASPITLETVQVRPAADQIAQQQHEAASPIHTLSAVQVRPSVGQIVERNAELSAHRAVVTLAAVEVRPSPEQRAALAADTTRANGYAIGSAAVATALGHWVITLPVTHLRPAALDLQTLAIGIAADLLTR